jgi:leucyl-tRNA synthetase
MHRLLQRLWRLIIDESTGAPLVRPQPPPSPPGAGAAPAPPDAALDVTTARLLHRTIAAVREDFAALRFHTAIARIIELTAHASRLPRAPRALTEPLVLMVAPLAPHIAEELWQRLGHPASLAYEAFPQADPALVTAETVTLPVQVDGKVRFTIEVPASATRDDIAELLASHPAYPRGEVARLVVVPGKIASISLAADRDTGQAPAAS